MAKLQRRNHNAKSLRDDVQLDIVCSDLAMIAGRLRSIERIFRSNPDLESRINAKGLLAHGSEDWQELRDLLAARDRSVIDW